jgi:8-oxo-dGTP pyrophosphatase MutT (NUDIX family)
MTFRQWLESSHDSGFFAARLDDPENNGLERGLAHYVPPPKSKSKTAKKIDKLFGKESIEVRERGAGFVFTDGKKVLLLLRSSKCSNPNTWGLPAGGLQDEEDFRQAAERESREEIGSCSGKTFYKSVEANGNWIFFFNKVPKPFKCKINKEHTNWKWVDLDEVKSYKLHPKLKKKINHYISIIKKKFPTS